MLRAGISPLVDRLNLQTLLPLAATVDVVFQVFLRNMKDLRVRAPLLTFLCLLKLLLSGFISHDELVEVLLTLLSQLLLSLALLLSWFLGVLVLKLLYVVFGFLLYFSLLKGKVLFDLDINFKLFL